MPFRRQGRVALEGSGVKAGRAMGALEESGVKDAMGTGREREGSVAQRGAHEIQSRLRAGRTGTRDGVGPGGQQRVHVGVGGGVPR